MYNVRALTEQLPATHSGCKSFHIHSCSYPRHSPDQLVHKLSQHQQKAWEQWICCTDQDPAVYEYITVISSRKQEDIRWVQHTASASKLSSSSPLRISAIALGSGSWLTVRIMLLLWCFLRISTLLLWDLCPTLAFVPSWPPWPSSPSKWDTLSPSLQFLYHRSKKYLPWLLCVISTLCRDSYSIPRIC